MIRPWRRQYAAAGSANLEDDLQQAKHVLETLLAENPYILKEPAPFIGVSELGGRTGPARHSSML
jgi:hypothetical protein